MPAALGVQAFGVPVGEMTPRLLLFLLLSVAAGMTLRFLGIGGGRGRDIATVAGAVAGGIAGQRVEESASRRQGVEITVRLDSGIMISVVQEADPNQDFWPGQPVRVLGQGTTARVTR